MQKCTRLFMIVAIMMLGINGFAQDRVLNFLSSFDAGSFDEGAAEIVAYDAASQTLFYVNAEVDAIGVLDISDPANPVPGTDIDITPYGEAVNSVAVSNGILAAAIEGMDQMPGKIVLFDNTGGLLAEYAAGVLPDMVTFSPNGQLVMSANEGEPDDDYMVDPEGSVTVVDISAGAAAGVVTQIPFDVLNDQKTSLISSGVRIFGPGATVAQDLEPEYIAVTDDNTIAYVSCQENNAMIVIDLTTSTIEGVLPLGFKDHNSGAPMLEEYRIDQVPTLPGLGTPVYDGGQPEVMLGGFSACGMKNLSLRPVNMCSTAFQIAAPMMELSTNP